MEISKPVSGGQTPSGTGTARLCRAKALVLELDRLKREAPGIGVFNIFFGKWKSWILHLYDGCNFLPLLWLLQLITNNITLSPGCVFPALWPLLSLTFCNFMLPPFVFPLLLQVLTSSYLQFAIPKRVMWLVLTKVIPGGSKLSR